MKEEKNKTAAKVTVLAVKTRPACTLPKDTQMFWRATAHRVGFAQGEKNKTLKYFCEAAQEEPFLLHTEVETSRPA